MNKRKTILVTGATSGVGKCIVALLATSGHTVIATGRSIEVLQSFTAPNIQTIQADLSTIEGIHLLLKKLPAIDVAIFSAGVGTFEYASDLTEIEIEQMLHVNIQAPILLAKELSRNMMKRKSGQLIFIGSQAGKVATPKASVYAATKHAIIGFTNALRMELAPFGIHVTAIHPGPIDTPFLDHADKTDTYRDSMKNVLLTPERVAEATVKTVGRNVREVNLPSYMAITSKLYAVAPSIVEKLGKRFFNKK
ncbi:SDR family NAD(P)-dependent oxidoreductase [Viridibacillus sp. YIM B01967]|uniref:SDR family NAD(P)-dependent oxidoreductase n=2 Tax=Viridibacillus soli TaxID=2798301 RepID=A0ABS1H710_9BACL|nr:SDR family NAD(P)-dependent oxidoreductase [Viridibacillus soli]